MVLAGNKDKSLSSVNHTTKTIHHDHHHVKVRRMFEFSYRPQAFYGFYREEVRIDGSLIEWGRDADVLVAVLNSDLQKQQFRGDMKKKKIHDE